MRKSCVFPWFIHQKSMILCRSFMTFSLLVLTWNFNTFFTRFCSSNGSEITSKRHQKFIISDYLSEESHFGVPRAHFGPHLGAIWGPLGSILILWDALWSQFWELWLPYGCFLLVWNRICQDFGCCWSHFGFIFAALHTSFIPVSFYNCFAVAPHKTPRLTSI